MECPFHVRITVDEEIIGPVKFFYQAVRGDRTARQNSVQIVIPDTAGSMLGYFISTFKKLLLIFLSLPSCKITKIPSAQYPA